MMFAKPLNPTFYNGKLPWRPNSEEEKIKPTPREMINDIVQKFIPQWHSRKERKKEDFNTIVEDIQEKFYTSIEKEEVML